MIMTHLHNEKLNKELLQTMEQLLSLNVNFTRALTLAVDEKNMWDMSNKELLSALKKYLVIASQDTTGINWNDEEQLKNILEDDIYD